jgi:hypothetical protein
MSDADKTFSNDGRNKAVMTDDERFALAKWFVTGMDVPEDEAQRKFMLAFAERDTVKWAQVYGAKLVAMLADRGHMEPGQNPVDALLNVLVDLEDLQRDES